MATDHSLTDFIRNILSANELKLSIKDKAFISRLNAGMASITHLYYQIYSSHPKKDEIFEQLIATLVRTYQSREKDLRKRDEEKAKKGNVVKYIGAIDDNYKDANAVTTKYVEKAVHALLQGKEVEQTETKAIGCSIKV